MSTKLQTTNDATSIMEQVIAKGDLSKLSPDERAFYYAEVCKSVSLNPLTQPFSYITLNGKLTLYANKGATDQLRALRNLSIRIVDQQVLNDAYIVTVEGTTPDGRVDTELGAVAITGLKGDAYCNALMKATTKAKRRLTLSMCGLGMLDETEVETIPNARPVAPDPPAPVARQEARRAQQAPAQREIVDADTGEVQQAPANVATDKQKKMLWALAKTVWAESDVANFALDAIARDELGTGYTSLSAVTRREASQLIDVFKTAEEEGDNFAALRERVASLIPDDDEEIPG